MNVKREPPNPCVAKVVLLGAENVGKSHFLKAFTNKRYNGSPTVGADMEMCQIMVNRKESLKLQIWDTAGRKEFTPLLPLYIDNAHGAMLMFDLTNYDSFLRMVKLIKGLRRLGRSDIVINMVGTKYDLSEQRVVDADTAILCASKIGARYFETDINDITMINHVFKELALGILSVAEERNHIKPEIDNIPYKNIIDLRRKKGDRINVWEPVEDSDGWILL